MIKQHFDDIDKIYDHFDKVIPKDVSYALIPGVNSIFKIDDKEIAKLIIDIVVDNYNDHFNDIYLPYTD